MRDQPQRWTLAFRDDALEREFDVESARAGQRLHRIIWCAGALVLAGGAFTDRLYLGSPGNLRVITSIRFGVWVPVFLAVAALGWASVETFARWRGTALTVGSLALAFGLSAVGFMLPNPELLASSDVELMTVLIVMAICLFLDTRFVVALSFLAAWLVFQDAFMWRIPQVDVAHFTFYYFFGAMVGLVAAWKIEQAQREAFLANRRSEQLLRNVLPAQIAERLKQDPSRIAEHFDQATVLFGDIAGFTPLSEKLSPAEIVAALDEVFSAFDDIAHRHGLEKIKTIGDAYMVVGGVPTPRADHAEAIAEMALEMREVISARRFAGGRLLAMRIGIHTGPVVAGVIGKKKFIYDLWGDTVNTASRMESHGVEGMVQVTAATWERLRDRYQLTSRGAVQVKGKGEMQTWFLEGRKSV